MVFTAGNYFLFTFNVEEDVDGIPMDRPSAPKKMMEWSPNRGTMIRPPENYEKPSSPKGGKWPQWADNENYKFEDGE